MKANELSASKLLSKVYFETECYDRDSKKYKIIRFNGYIEKLLVSFKDGAYGYCCVFENCYQKKINFIIKDRSEFKSLIGENLELLQIKN